MNKPTFFILFLILILTFILGFRYGQYVEKSNKKIDYILSITSSPTYTPYPEVIKNTSNSSTLKPNHLIPTITNQSKP